MPRRFETVCPPLCETFAFRNKRPCRVEDPSQPEHDQTHTSDCPYEMECELTAVGLPLHLTYRGGFKVTQSEPSSSITIRSEHQFHGDDRLRLSLRKHLYEMNSAPRAPVVLTEGICEAILASMKAVAQRERLAVAERLATPIDLRPLTSDEIDRFAAHLTHLRNRGQSWSPHERAQAAGLLAAWLQEHTQLTADQATAWGEQAATGLFAHSRCYSLHEDDRFGQYLGFVDLRLNSLNAPLAMGLLVPPRHLRSDPLVRCIVGEYGPLFGAHGFSSTIYTMHEPILGGARCAQACVIMATGMLADRGARLTGSFELTSLGHAPDPSHNGGSLPFEISGLRFPETARLLNSHHTQTTARAVRQSGTRNARRLAERLIEAYVVARFPIVMFVDAPTWNPAGYSADADDRGHAVVITGLRYHDHRTGPLPVTPGVPTSCRANVLSHLVVHDPSLRPFALWPTDACFHASEQFQFRKRDESEPAAHEPGGCLHLIFVADAGTEVHAVECLEAIATRSPDSLQHDRQRLHHYYADDDKELRFALVHRDDVLATYFHGPESLFAGTRDDDLAFRQQQLAATQEHLQREFPERLATGRYWAIAGFQSGRLRTLWLCSTRRKSASGRNAATGWHWRFDIDDDGRHSTTDRRFQHFSLSSELAAVEERLPPPPRPPLVQLPRAEVPRHELVPSVLTSCSERSLRPLINEIVAVNGQRSFDLFVLRERDVLDMVRDGRLFDPAEPNRPLARDAARNFSSAHLLATPGNRAALAGWLSEQLADTEVRLAAFATYFPQIANLTDERPENPQLRHRTLREIAVEALANVVCLGLELREASERRWMDAVIVELVCGTILDRAGEGRSAKRVVRRTFADKFAGLLESLTEVVSRVEALRGRQHERWALGLELEPGDTYVLQNQQGLVELFGLLEGDVRFAALRPHLGLNVDVAHMRMANVHPSVLRDGEGLGRRVVHSHLADHPGMHTRDQAIGDWMPVDRYDAKEYEFLLDIAESFGRRGPTELPYSGCVALELEGCNRIAWIHRSLTAMRHMCATVKHHPDRIRRRQRRP